jgi:hypothetical protein
MLLSVEVRLQLQHDRGLYVLEACDRCGQLLGPARFTRRGDSGVWCSRECRSGVDAAQLRILSKGGRPRKHKNNAEKCRAHRSRTENVLTDTKPVFTPLKTNELQTQNRALAITTP